MESPGFMTVGENRKEFPKFDKNFINVTMTYRSDSHISASYHILEDLPKVILRGDGKQWVEKKLAKKKKIAVRIGFNTLLYS